VPGKTCRQAKRPLNEKVKGGFYEQWYALPDDITEIIIEKMREWHPPFDWRNPERGED
jgi:hypothetical protein